MVVIKMYIILVYDISLIDNGQRVWRRVYKICKKYLRHVQNSVFEGEVTKAQLFELRKSIDKEIRDHLDSVVIFKTRSEKWLDRDIIGIQEDPTSNFL